MSARLDSLLDRDRLADCAAWDDMDRRPPFVPRTDAELIADTSEDDACALRMAIEDAQTSLKHALAALDDRDLPSAEKCAAAALEDLSNALEA